MILPRLECKTMLSYQEEDCADKVLQIPIAHIKRNGMGKERESPPLEVSMVKYVCVISCMSARVTHVLLPIRLFQIAYKMCLRDDV